MSIFGKKRISKIPEGFTAKDIKIEASTCTGERTIGFYNSAQGRLMYAELVKNDRDIAEFYDKYGVARE